VELKLDAATSSLQLRNAFNRTIVELKLVFSCDAHLHLFAFNRTIVELKHADGVVSNEEADL